MKDDKDRKRYRALLASPRRNEISEKAVSRAIDAYLRGSVCSDGRSLFHQICDLLSIPKEEK